MTIAPGEDILADDVLTVGTAGAWTAYTPAWSGTGGSPSVGAGGSLVGRYKQIGKIVHVAVYMLLGTAPSFPTGGWAWSLPVNASAISDIIRNGSAYYNDSSALGSGHFVGICSMQPLLSVTKFFAFGGVSNQVTSIVPFTWAAADKAAFTLTYEAA
jgi:hypothetical protein